MGVRLAAALMAVLVLASIGGFLAHERSQTLEQASALSGRRAARLAGEVGEALAVAEVAVRRIEVRLEQVPPGDPVAGVVAALAAEQRPLLAALPQPLRLLAVGADGRPLAADAATPAEPETLPGAAGWQVGLTRGGAGRRSVPVLRRAAPNRHGVAAFVVELDHAALLARLESSRTPDGGSAALFRIDVDGSTTLLARAPLAEAEIGRRVRGPLAAAVVRSPRGSFSAQTQLDQERRVVAYQRLDGDLAVLVVAYGMATDAVLAGWRALLPWAASATLLLLAAIGAGWRRLEGALLLQASQQEALQRSEGHLRTLAANLPDVVVRMDRDGRHRYANPAVEQATGLPPESFIGKTNADLGMPADNVAQWTAALRRVFEGAGPERLEFAYPGPHGLRHWESVVALEPPVPGEPPTVLVISRDISERKQAEAAREASNRRLADVLESMSDGFVSLDRNWRYVALNAKGAQLLGRDAASLVGKHIWTEFPEGMDQPFRRAYERAMNEGVTLVLEEHYAPWDRWFENRIYPTTDGIAIFFTDITERRQMLQALQGSEARYRLLFERNPVPMWVYDRGDLRLLAVNQAFCRHYGYAPDEVLAMRLPDFYPVDERDAIVAVVGSLTGHAYVGEWHHLKKDGSLITIEARSHDIEFDGHIARIATLTDISDRKAADRALQHSEQRLREAQRLASIGSWELDMGSGALEWSDEIFRIFELDPARFEPDYGHFLTTIHPEDRAAVDRAWQTAVAEHGDYAITHRLLLPDGRIKHVQERGHCRYADDGTPLLALGTVQDVTARVQAEQALRESEASHREMFDSNPHPMWVYDLETLAFLAVNDAAIQKYGHARDEFLRMTIKDIRPTEDVSRLLSNVRQVTEGYDDAGTWRHRTKDGRLLEVEISSHTLRYEGRAAELVLAHDVTRRNQAERAVRDNEERLRLALQAAQQGLYDLDLRTGEAVVSPEYATMLGYVPADFHETNAAWRERLHPDDREQVEQVYLDYVAGRRPDYRVEFRQRLRNGGWKWILSIGCIQERDADGQPLRLLGTHTDLDPIKAAQAAETAATRRFESLFEAAPEAISVSTFVSGHFMLANDAFCELFGRPREQVIGRTAQELQMWTDVPARETIVQRLRAGEPVRDVEGVARRGDGPAVDVMFSAERIEFAGQEALLLMFRDISERKRLDSALRASQARLAHLLSRAPTVVYTARAGGDFGATYYSPNLPKLLGWQPQDFLADSGFWLGHVHPDDREALLQQMDALVSRDELVLEYRFQHADGGWRWMRDQVSVQRDEHGQPIELVGAWIDITERREAEAQVRQLAAALEQRVQERTAQLAQSEARYRAIFETVPVSIGEEDWSGVQQLLRELRAQGVNDGPGYFATRPDFVHQCLQAVKVQRLNRKALALHDLGSSPDGAPDLKTFYPTTADEAQFIGELEAMWAGQRLFSAKRSLPSITGRPLNLMMTMSLPGLDDGDGTALVCLVDITEIDRLNAELDRSVERLKMVNRELETFTYSVSHDLKAPLRGIDGYSRLLLSDHLEQLDDEGRQFLHHIRQATQHMGVLIDDLLTYSRLERRDQTLAPLPLADLVETALAGFRADLAATGVQVEVKVVPGLRVQADAQGLTMALRNLIDNAVKFSRASVPPRITIAAARSKDGVELTVQDNGVGFDMKFRDRIFSIFQRLHRAEDYPGTGIGLAIVRKAVERMGGRVWGKSQPGQSTTFTIELPEAL